MNIENKKKIINNLFDNQFNELKPKVQNFAELMQRF